MDYQVLMTVLRFIHISCGAFWAGGVAYMAMFIIPAVAAAGPSGGAFMQQLPRTRNMPNVMTTVATLTIFSGLWLFYIVSSGFSMSFIATQHGFIVCTGGVLGLIAYSIGIFVNLPTTKKMAALGATIALSGQPPTPEQMKEIGIYRARLMKATNYVAVILMTTVSIMAIMRYL